MKTVLVLGSGMVAKPFVEEMLEQGFRVTCVDVEKNKAMDMIGNHPNGQADSFNVLEDKEKLDALIKASDLVTSLLPPPFHPVIAKRCLAQKTQLLTTSYLSDEMKALHSEAEQAGVLFLNETGLDPGLDHMAAMDLKNDVERAGGKVTGFQSHCGGFPAPSAANNPIRYKFSWNPSGVLGALSRPSSFMKDEKVIEVPGEAMLANSIPIFIPGEGIFETTPNGHGPYYAEKYGMNECRDIRRGTLRYPGWARFWSFVQKMGWLEKERKIQVENAEPFDIFKELSDLPDHTDFVGLIQKQAPKQASMILEVFYSLGFFHDSDLTGEFSCFDVFLKQTQRHWQYAKGELDKVILYNCFHVEIEGRKEVWTSVLSMEGKKGSHSAMAMLVGLPCAIAGTLMLKGVITEKGVNIPLKESIYKPILEGLKAKGISFEKRILS